MSLGSSRSKERATIETQDETVAEYRQRHGAVGSLLLVFGIILVIARGLESAFGLPGLPRTWYQNDWLWWLVGLASIAAGGRFLSRAEVLWRPDHWTPTRPGLRFHRLVLYTRSGCHLCDEAAETLQKYRKWLPAVQQVDIDTDPKLREKFTTCVPVVEADGKIRFRGRVSEVLLRRLIEGQPPRED